MTSDAVEAAELWRVELPMRRPFATSTGTATSRPLVLVRLLAGGGEGWGECDALGEPTYTEEYADGAERMLADHLLPRLLAEPLLLPPLPVAPPATVTGAGAAAGAAAADTFAAVAPGLGPWVASAMGRLGPVRGQPMAKAAVELALLDLVLRRAGVGLARWLGATVELVAAGMAIPLLPGSAQTVAAAELAAGLGYRRLKLKIAPGRDVERVAAVRAALPGVALLADANGSYRRSERAHLELLRELDGLGLAALEQPLAAEELLGHARLAQELVTPLLLDESVGTPGQVELLAAARFHGAVSIKPPRLGGVLAALDTAQRARRAGLHASIGGTLESGLGRRAALALAGRAELDLPGELSPTGEYLAEDLVPPLQLLDGELPLPVGPGVGVVPDPAALRAWSLRRHAVRASAAGGR